VHCKLLRPKDSLDADMFPSSECFPEHDKEYKRRLGFAITAAVLTHSSNILVGVIMMRFRNDNQSEEDGDLIDQDGGLPHKALDKSSESQLNNSSDARLDSDSNIQYAKWTIWHKTGAGIATVIVSIIFTGIYYKTAQFPVVRSP